MDQITYQTSTPTDTTQNKYLAHLLGAAEGELCPGLKNSVVYQLLDPQDSLHLPRTQKIITHCNTVRVTDDTMNALIAKTQLSAKNVSEIFLQLAIGIQYGFEQRPEWNVEGQKDFLVAILGADYYGNAKAYYSIS